MTWNKLAFWRKREISLGRVHDTIVFREGSESLRLRVDSDPMRMMAGLVQAQKQLEKWTDKTSIKAQKEFALYFAGVIFGEEQAAQLLDFYRGSAGCVVNVCGQYFQNRLRHKIDKAVRSAQKKAET